MTTVPIELDVLIRVVALVETLIAEVRGLRADLRRDRRPARGLSRADRDRLVNLLPAIVGAIGSEPFTVSEVLEVPAVRVVLKTLPAPQVGQLLQRARGVPIDWLVVECVGHELHRRLWSVCATV